MLAKVTELSPDILRQEIAQRVRLAREAKGIGREDFAVAMGRTTYKWARDIEHGRTSIKAEEIRVLARLLDKPVNWLLGYDYDSWVFVVMEQAALLREDQRPLLDELLAVLVRQALRSRSPPAAKPQ